MTDSKTPMGRPRVLVDFDGVIHRYREGWKDGSAYDVPMAGAREALADMERDGYEVVIFSTRDAEQIAEWMRSWGYPERRITSVKEPAVAMIDDRAITFTDWKRAARQLRDRFPVREHVHHWTPWRRVGVHLEPGVDPARSPVVIVQAVGDDTPAEPGFSRVCAGCKAVEGS